MNSTIKTILNILAAVTLMGSIAWAYNTWFDYEPFLAVVGSVIALLSLNYSSIKDGLSNDLSVKGNSNISIQQNSGKDTPKSNKATVKGNDNFSNQNNKD